MAPTRPLAIYYADHPLEVTVMTGAAVERLKHQIQELASKSDVLEWFPDAQIYDVLIPLPDQNDFAM
jgi:hypothetical protein